MRSSLHLIGVVLAASTTLLSAVACGGDEATPTPTSPIDAGTAAEEDASTEVDRPEEREDAGTGATFTDLYRDLFGPTGKASCAGDGLCHGAPEKAGAKGSSGFVCSDATTCWTTLTTGGSALVTASDASSPTTSALYLTLRHRRDDGSIVGNMPKRPLYVFSSASMDRVTTWIRNGAKND